MKDFDIRLILILLSFQIPLFHIAGGITRSEIKKDLRQIKTALEIYLDND